MAEPSCNDASTGALARNGAPLTPERPVLDVELAVDRRALREEAMRRVKNALSPATQQSG